MHLSWNDRSGANLRPALAGFALLVSLAGCNTVVPVPPQKPGESVSDVLLPGGKPVGAVDGTARVLGGGEDAAAALFARLTPGARVVTPLNFPGEIRQRADGSSVTYLFPTADTPPTILIRVLAPDRTVVIRELSFPPGRRNDGGGEM